VVLLVFTQTDINKFFSASREYCGGGGLEFLRLGPSLAEIFTAAASWQNHGAAAAGGS